MHTSLAISYANWKINGNRVTRRLPDATQLELDLVHGKHVALEGWYGEPPECVDTAIMGICCWDARWQVLFQAQDKKSLPARRVMAMPIDRTEALQKMRKGTRPEMMQVPVLPGEYHHQMLRFQAHQLKVLNPRRVLYHLPDLEYHAYIQEFETGYGAQCPQLHEALEEFCAKLQNAVVESLGAASHSRIEFIRPMAMGMPHGTDSYLFPYLHPEAFDADPASLIGIEDLIEVRLAHEVAQRTGRCTPVRVGVLSAPHPYLDKTVTTGIAHIAL